MSLKTLSRIRSSGRGEVALKPLHLQVRAGELQVSWGRRKKLRKPYVTSGFQILLLVKKESR